MKIVDAVYVCQKYGFITLMVELEDSSIVDVFSWYTDEKHWHLTHKQGDWIGKDLEDVRRGFLEHDQAQLTKHIRF